jgi:hypothetical protein
MSLSLLQVWTDRYKKRDLAIGKHGGIEMELYKPYSLSLMFLVGAANRAYAA